MAFLSRKLLRIVRNIPPIRHNLLFTSAILPNNQTLSRMKTEIKTENDLKYVGDPDKFGTISKIKPQFDIKLEEEGDIQEENHLQYAPPKSQKLTIKQYADIMKQFLKHKRLKEAIDVLEVRMLKEDQVKPENYLYNILIGGCAEVGYTKKAFKLFNDMKKRGLKSTGDTYTCLFEACCNSPWKIDGLKNATHLRALMLEKGIEPNLTNYNAMIKAFGRCGDLETAFRIVDEMVGKKIKIRVHTFNHLLHACISDSNHGLRHALVVWRKMLIAREKPNIYSFNLMLKCVKECNLGSMEDIQDLLGTIQEHMAILEIRRQKMLEINSKEVLLSKMPDEIKLNKKIITLDKELVGEDSHEKNTRYIAPPENCNSGPVTKHSEVGSDLESKSNLPSVPSGKRFPNLLSMNVRLDHVVGLQVVQAPSDKFAIIGGMEDFLNEMQNFSVKPDIKIFTQMVAVLEDNKEAENKLLETIKTAQIKPDISFYNMLIKKRCLRSDYSGAFEVKELIEKESKRRKRKFPLKKKWALTKNIMTYGVLAMACNTKEQGEVLLNEMQEKQLRVNAEILGTLLKNGTTNEDFLYIMYILDVALQENVTVNEVFLKHLENFNNRCKLCMKQGKWTDDHSKNYTIYYKKYLTWLKKIDTEKILNHENPWNQFKDTYPETLQRQKIKIMEPKRFYKRDRRFVQYIPRVKV